ncbi:DUF7382 domain-containing protein [Halorientalis litorea]|jgi:hypothetical protein|uniref:DUF7382 domain-containing protein n=1 Tax=Halorientalis litorea TaxID=2931977 RepID=UPI001FF11569|nr:carboxypeptidase regulatory-like domain-containing protein [Halorientalis litorea]
MFERFTEDERAIEGLPIRLVIALVVGVASLSVMMNTIAGLETLGVTELDATPEPEVVSPGQQTVTVRVVTPQGDPVSEATVVAKGGTATLANVSTARTGPDGNATLTLDPSLGPNQRDGVVEFDIKPPTGGQYTDRRANTKLLVVSA